MMNPAGAAISRRLFLASAAAFAAGDRKVALGAQPAGQTAPGGLRRKLRVAAINSIFRLRSHAYHIVGRLVHGFAKDGFHHQPEVQVVRMFNDQSPPDDLSRGFCDRHGIELCTSAAPALTGAIPSGKAEGGRLTLILARRIGEAFTGKNVDAAAVTAFLDRENAGG